MMRRSVASVLLAGALAAALRRLCEDEAFRRAAGLRSREVASRFTPEAWADAVASLVGRMVR
jgi:hypothetical protein